MKIRPIPLAAALILAAGISHAAGDPQTGQGKAYPCTACHGADGLKQAPGQPLIGGRPAGQLLAAMHDFRSLKRFHPYMQILLLSMTEKDMEDIAAYYAGVGKAPPTKAVK